MNLRGLGSRTQEAYLSNVYHLARFYHRDPRLISNEEVHAFLQGRVDQGLSASTINVGLNAMVCYYRDHLGRDTEGAFSVLPKKRKKQRKGLPKYYSRNEITQLLGAVSNHRERLFLMFVYGCGLRLSECTALRWRDVCLDRGLVFVDRGKGGKDRYLPLARALKSYLKTHYHRELGGADDAHIFQSGHKRRSGEAITGATGQQWYERALRSGCIRRRGGIHCLRHSYATHQLELGVDIRRLQLLMGHDSVKTTMIYLHVGPGRMDDYGSPLDALDFDSGENAGGPAQ